MSSYTIGNDWLGRDTAAAVVSSGYNALLSSEIDALRAKIKALEEENLELSVRVPALDLDSATGAEWLDTRCSEWIDESEPGEFEDSGPGECWHDDPAEYVSADTLSRGDWRAMLTAELLEYGYACVDDDDPESCGKLALQDLVEEHCLEVYQGSFEQRGAFSARVADVRGFLDALDKLGCRPSEIYGKNAGAEWISKVRQAVARDCMKNGTPGQVAYWAPRLRYSTGGQLL